ncbi:hypothetical protein MNEG_11918 [Monoraphidium neglectum]|uniref:Uncharacterized protein n=1 Tax=Monoraphidium neglectum TaxID=145388 RepID=A0A0D2KJM6_9CHLO|nr:hypothetical protein MNEG_11918 [Monoraphidium neglectum]KIY96043.1 hypothetical protein MNEG_11918 [Monoraphidium neglectum]|eukprot:XP_013895063.1 hypothetical protein MNEG_11918 [Monoraphidium neglectum]
MIMPKPVVLFKFDNQKEVDRWQGAAAFTGRCSTELDDDADLARAGYCAANSKARPRPRPRPRSAGWTDVRIPLRAFLLTYKGRLVEGRMELPKDRVVSVGVAISALASSDPEDEARSGVEQRPSDGGGGGAAAAAGGGEEAAAAAAGAAGGEQQQERADLEADVGASEPVVLTSNFKLLLRQIRAEGRAGVTGPAEA